MLIMMMMMIMIMTMLMIMIMIMIVMMLKMLKMPTGAFVNSSAKKRFHAAQPLQPTTTPCQAALHHHFNKIKSDLCDVAACFQ
jgi:hypothetical protein